MKNLIIFCLLALTLVSFSIHFSTSERAATVEKQDGLYIFWECKPVDPYEVIGIAKEPGVTMTKQTYTQRKRHFINDALEYKDADGIVYNPDVSGHYKALIIKFK